MKKLQLEDVQELSAEDIINGINQGAHIVEVALPVIQLAFKKIAEWVKSLKIDDLAFPHGKRVHIEALEAQNQLQKQLNKLFEKRLTDLENK